MVQHTPNLGVPYVEVADTVTSYPVTSQELALGLDSGRFGSGRGWAALKGTDLAVAATSGGAGFSLTTPSLAAGTLVSWTIAAQYFVTTPPQNMVITPSLTNLTAVTGSATGLRDTCTANTRFNATLQGLATVTATGVVTITFSLNISTGTFSVGGDSHIILTTV